MLVVVGLIQVFILITVTYLALTKITLMDIPLLRRQVRRQNHQPNLNQDGHCHQNVDRWTQRDPYLLLIVLITREDRPRLHHKNFGGKLLLTLWLFTCQLFFS